MGSIQLDNLLDQKVQSDHIYSAFAEIQKKSYDRAEQILNEGIEAARDTNDPALLALLYSSLGVLYKIKRDFREAWRYYDQAERLLPDNPVFKLISARLLIEIFSQYDIAIRKMKKVEEMQLQDPLMLHHVDATYGLAYARKGNKALAQTYLKNLLSRGFEGMISAANIDFKLVELCVRKGWSRELCNEYLAKALVFARQTDEEPYIRLFDRLLNAARSENTQVI